MPTLTENLFHAIDFADLERRYLAHLKELQPDRYRMWYEGEWREEDEMSSDRTNRNRFHDSRFQLDDGTIAHAGMIVKLKTGNAPIELRAVYICDDRGIPVADGFYTKSGIDVWNRSLKHFEPMNPVGAQFEEIDAADFAADQKETTMATLYQTNEETPRFGTFLTKDSQGRIVREMKGGGGVEAFPTSDVEEVMPYTIAVQQLTDSHNSRVHIEMPKGQVVKDDLLLSLADGNMYRVVQLDTKSKRATDVATYKFRKVATTALGETEDDGESLIE